MNKIGFKNFRRYTHLEPLEYKGITFLVGRNNAGKSTLVKALLLIDNYFKSNSIEIFPFGNSVLEDANIVTYGRAKNVYISSNYMEFTQQIENYLIVFSLSGEDDKSFANVDLLHITDLEYQLHFMFNMRSRSLAVIKEDNNELSRDTESLISILNTQIIEAKEEVSSYTQSKTSKEFIELVSKVEKLEKKLEDIQFNIKNSATPKAIFAIDQDFGDVQSLTEIVDDFLLNCNSQHDLDFKASQSGETPSSKFEALRALKELDPIFVESSFSHFMTLMKDFSIAYLGANPAKQSALFSIRDKNNALAQAIHEFKQYNIASGEEEHRFVLKWMESFEIGSNFVINMYGGEAYEMLITSYEKEVQLADKGMGSIQAMLLIMRIACVIRKIKIAEKNSTKTRIIGGISVQQDSDTYRLIDRTTITIEEPEVNLHPALQSKLADLFLEVHQTYKIDFLIETHSEYILRRSQVLVADKDFEIAPNDNPFCVHYFPKEFRQSPYTMKYQSDGTFDKNFGEGFFDEASSSTLELLKIKRQKKPHV